MNFILEIEDINVVLSAIEFMVSDLNARPLTKNIENTLELLEDTKEHIMEQWVLNGSFEGLELVK